MAEIMGMLKRVKKVFNNDNPKRFEKLTADEVELRSFEERERLDNVKRRLLKFRKQNAMLKDFNPDKHFGDKAISILQQKPTLNAKSTFNHKTNLLNGSNKKVNNILEESRKKVPSILGGSNKKENSILGGGGLGW